MYIPLACLSFDFRFFHWKTCEGGVCARQLACAAALLAPRLPHVKEWAYTGAFFNYSSALVSHLFAGDPPDISAAVLGVFNPVLGPAPIGPAA